MMPCCEEEQSKQDDDGKDTTGADELHLRRLPQRILTCEHICLTSQKFSDWTQTNSSPTSSCITASPDGSIQTSHIADGAVDSGDLAVGSVGPVLVEEIVESGEVIEWSRDFITPFYREKAEFAANLLMRELEGLPFRIHVPEGAFFLWLWLPGLPITSNELYERLKRNDVFVISGHHFFPRLETDWAHRNECLRISFAQRRDVVVEGLRAIAAEVKRAFGCG